MSHAALNKRLAAGILLANLFVLVLVGLSLRQGRLQYENRTAVTTQNLAHVLEQFIDGSFDKVDLILLSAVDEIESKLSRDRIDRKSIDAFLTRQSVLLPELDRIRMVDARGEVVQGAGLKRGVSISAADRGYFRRLREDPNAGLVITEPLLSRVTGKWSIILARRINNTDGSLAGAICGVILLEYFPRTFSSIDVGKHGAISLRDREQGIVARYPEPPAGSPIGQKGVSGEFSKLLAAGQKGGTFKAYAPVDKIERLYTFRKFSNYPFYVNVGLATGDYLEEWQSDVAKMSAAAALFCLFTLFVSWLIYNDWKIRHSAILALERQEAKFRTIADYTHDGEFWLDPDGSFVHSSPSCKRITGYDVGAFYDDPGLLSRIVHPEDKEMFALHRHETNGDSGTDSLVFRICHVDGSVRWLEHVCQPIVNEAGVFLGIRGSNRDITKRKLAERRLADLNDCFLGFTADVVENIDQLVTLCGEQMGATCALYNRLEGDILHAVCGWNTTADFMEMNPAAGHICHAVIRSREEKVTVIRNLQESDYAKSDPNIARYGLNTYVGKPVSFGGSCTGSLCVGSLDDWVPEEEDKKLLGIIASAIGVEEERMRVVEALRKSDATPRSITSSTRDAIMMIDQEGKISFWNEAAVKIFGWE